MNLFDKYKSELILSVGDILSNMSKECVKIAEKDCDEEILYESRTRFLKIKVVRNKNGVYFTRSFGDKNKTSKVIKRTRFTFDFNRKQEVETGFDVKSGANSEGSVPYATIEVDQDGTMTINYSEIASNVESDIGETIDEIQSKSSQAETELKTAFTNINSQLSQILANQNEMMQSMQTQYATAEKTIYDLESEIKDSYNAISQNVHNSILTTEQNIDSRIDSAKSSLEKEMQEYSTQIMGEVSDVRDEFQSTMNTMNNFANEITKEVDDALYTIEDSFNEFADEFNKEFDQFESEIVDLLN